jgi:hypothetical protein
MIKNINKIRNYISWDITPCSPVKSNLRFGGIYRLHLQDPRVCKYGAGRKQSNTLTFTELHSDVALKTELQI